MTPRAAVGLALAAILLTGCAGRTPPAPPGPPDPAPAAEALVNALSRGDLTGFPATVDAQAELSQILAGMDGISPTVTHGDLRTVGDVAEVPLTYVWPFEAAKWEYTSTGTLNWTGTEWRLNWTAGMIHPQLNSQNRLVHTPRAAQRGRILDSAGRALTEERAVMRVGIDKTRVEPEAMEEAARRLAATVNVNADNFVARLQAAGPEAFVEAIVVRHDHELPEDWRQIPGAISVPETRTLAVDRAYAPEIIGIVGPASKEQAAAAGSTVLVGDPIGLSGLQRRQDPMLRGKSGAVITLAPRRRPTPLPTATPPPGPAPSPTPRPVVFEVQPRPARDLVTTFDSTLQKRAEQVMEGVPGSAAIVAVRPSDGAILAAAVSPGSGADPDATFGHFAPGSTFKVVTALALLRSGLTPDSPVNCTETVTVDGRTLRNYSDYPAGKLGRITLADAVAQSCNTALIAEHERITPEDLRRAAASLGLGEDWEAGFSSFFGQVPDPPNVVGEAEAMIGQGAVEASPMAMAGVAASVAAGRTVRPQLIPDYVPPEPATPLTAEEGAALKSMMGAAVSEGTATSLAGVLDGAKTGTAEFGTGTPLKTHAWLIGYRGDLAVAVWVREGASGSRTAGPIMRDFLAG